MSKVPTDVPDPLDAFMEKIHAQVSHERNVSRFSQVRDLKSLAALQKEPSHCSGCGKQLARPKVAFSEFVFLHVIHA